MKTISGGLCGLLCVIVLAGCRNRAYTDVYIENMAAEIRDLENQLYEYDHEYRLLEQELQTLRQQNAAIKSTLQTREPNQRSLTPPPSSQRSPQPLEFQPRNQGSPVIPEPALGADEVPAESESILENGRGGGTTPPAEEIPRPRSGALPPSSNNPESTAPELRNPNSTPPSIPNLPKSPTPSQDKEFDLEDLLPPTIDPGIPSPPPLPAVTRASDGTPVAPENNLEMNLSRIEIPTQRTPAQSAANSAIKQATIQVTTEKVTDTRVVELAFHPTLSRSLDMDDRPDDDGVYLVLQPKNERGQMVPVAANLTIMVLDPAREGEAAKIGRWEYTSAEVNERLQPIGSEQGIHFRLPWNGPDPSADRVIVFALFKFENGRQVMGEKEIYISGDGSHKTVWTSRGGTTRSDTAQPVVRQSEVAQASYTTSTLNGASVSGSSSSGAQVVRPVSGSSTFELAPQPH